MNYYDVFLKNKINSSKPDPARIFSPKPLSEMTLRLIGNMDFEEASSYCRNVLRASIMRGHPTKDHE